MDKVSIIVPVYNAENFIDECVKSLVNQTYQDLEIILINDGSKDKSYDICKKYSEKDDRVILVNKANSGVGDTRNTGINMASGKFVLFVDSDDYIKNNTVETLVNSIEKNSQLVLFGINRVSVNGVTPLGEYDILSLEINEFIESYWKFASTLSLACPVNKLFVRDIIVNNKLMFEKDVKIGEDLRFCLTYFAKCNQIQVIDKNLYYYRYNENSASEVYQENLFKELTELFKRQEKFARTNGNIKHEDIETSQLYSLFITCLMNLFKGDNTSKFRKNEIKKYIENELLTRDRIPPNGRAKKMLYNLVKKKNVNGIYFMAKMGYFAYNVRNKMR